ncbi:MAG TPA: hypothetical protein VIK18_26600 [Pirellulales bacterium]
MTRSACRWLATLAVAGIMIGGSWAGWGRAADDGRRAVDVKRFGICVRVPQAWRLISWARDSEAFKLSLPQDTAASKGFVECHLGLAPEQLDELLKSEQPVQPVPDRPLKTRLLECRVEPIAAGRLAAQVHERLLAIWELQNDAGDRTFEIRCRMVFHGTLYSFTLVTDEAHYDAYRLDFEDMLASAQFSTPETGVERIAGGLWLQRDFRFALRLPKGWKPAFGPSDKALLFAAGPPHAGLTDSLVVEATASRPLDLEKLKTTLPAELGQRDSRARATCEIVPQGATFALETRISTWQGQVPVSVLERRFRSARRNYIIRFKCETGRLDELEPEFMKSLDSFVEVLDTPGRDQA